MAKIHLNVIDDFDARKIFEGLRSYSRGVHNKKEVQVKEGSKKADRVNYRWQEETLEFLDLKTEARLTYYNFPSEIPGQSLPLHTLEIEVSGGEQAIIETVKKISGKTGINLEKYTFNF